MAAAMPGKVRYWLAGLVGTATTIAAIAIVAWLIATFDYGTQFLVPGRHTVELANPGTYIVWSDHKTVFKGRSYEEAEKVPQGGARVHVKDLASGTGITAQSLR